MKIMCSMSVLCPLCAQTSFSSIDALRCSLIKAANGPLACPICHELFLGLDKLTIHLFSHTNIMNANDNSNSISISNPNNIKHIPKIIPTTIQQSVNTNNNNNINHINSNHNNENFKTKEENTVDTTSAVHQQNHSDVVNFENNHHSQQAEEDNMVQRALVRKTKLSKADARKINKKPQVFTAPDTNVNDTPPNPQTCVVSSTPATTSLATCDICEFTFRNDELRDMHVRLVHQNLICSNLMEMSNDPTLPNTNSQFSSHAPEPDFKCHLCSKTFKMKGSLRVHLKVVHLMGLPYVNNSPKLTICDRIRHKESKQLKVSNAASTDSNTSNHPSNLYNLHPISLLPTLSNTLNTTHTQSEFLPNSLDRTNVLSSNVVLAFNNNNINQGITVNPSTEKDTTSPSTNANLNSSAAMGLSSNLNSADNAKIWECDVCSKAFTTKYFLKKHKRLHTGDDFLIGF